MNYPNIKKAGLSHADLSEAFGYKNVASFRRSNRHKSMMEAVEKILSKIYQSEEIKSGILRIEDRIDEIKKEINELKKQL